MTPRMACFHLFVVSPKIEINKNVHNAFSPCFVAPQKNVVESVQKKNLHFVTYCQKVNGDVLKYFSIRTLVFGKPLCTVSL